MAFQKPEYLSLDGMSILDDPRPSLSQPVLENGIYLRWAFGPQRAFPLHGYHLFRRTSGDSERRCLSTVIGPLRPGPQGNDKLDTTLGRLWATEGALLLTDDFDPHGSAEVSLAGLRSLQLDLPAGVLAWKVTAKIGFLTQQPSTEIDFKKLPSAEGPNPRVEGDIQLIAFRKPGERMPSTRIRTGPRGNGIECSPRLNITLTRPAVRLAMIFSRRKQDAPLEIKAWNQDGTVAASARYEGDGVTLALEGKAITQVVINAPSELALLQWLKVDRQNDAREIEAFVMRGNARATSTRITGKPGEVVTTEFRVEDVNTVMFSGGPAALIDLCYWVRGGGGAGPGPQPKPWAKVPGFPYPLTLPITFPGYPASSGTEALSLRRAEAAQRIHYGSAAAALPAKPRIPGPGTITIQQGSALVTGKDTNWDTSLVGQMLFPRTLDTAYAVMAVLAPDRLVLSRPYRGWGFEDFPYELADEDVFAQVHDQIGAVLGSPTAMRAATMPPVIEQSRRGQNAVLQDGSTQVMGQGTSWSRNLEGLLLEAGPNGDVYRIVEVKSAQEITLHAPYVGKSGTFSYRIVSRSPHNRIEEGPSLQVSPLDLLELASLAPQFAQLLGLSWIDASAERDITYDYMLLADHGGRFNRDGTAALAWLNGTPDFESDVVDGSSLNITHSGSPVLAAPTSLQAFALPAGRLRLRPDRPDLADSEPALSISDLDSWKSRPPAQQPLMLEVWRFEHGTNTPPPASPPAPGTYRSLNERFLPARRTTPPDVPRPQGWPDPAKVHYLDAGNGGLDVGWYSYRVLAIDVHGRYSALSPPIPWRSVIGDAQIHPYAVHLEDRTPPPAPTDVMAWILEPDSVKDPMRVADSAYVTWRAKVGAGVVGLRVRWRWPWSHELRAPDLAEFRVYAQPTPLNARFHRVLSVVPADATRSIVKLAATDSLADDAYAGATLQIKERGYPIDKSRGGANLQLRVTNGGPTSGEAPPADTDATIVLPYRQALHRDVVDPRHWERWLGAVAKMPTNATVRFDIDVFEDPDVDESAPDRGLRGTGARWTAATRTLDLLPSKISRVRPGIDMIYLLVNAASTPADIQHYFEIESVDAARQSLVLAGAVSLLANGQKYDWRIGTPVRVYEAFFPSGAGAPDDPQIGNWLKPSLDEPVAYATIGVSAADKRTEVADWRPKRTPPRPGNEGLFGSPATVFRVHREPPLAPADGAWDAEKLMASRAGYDGKSFFSVRWPTPDGTKAPYYKALIFRASSETLFQVDKEQKRTYPLTFTAANDPRPSHWTPTRKAKVATELFAAPVADYAKLSDDALSVLGNLSGNDEAFTQITIDPLLIGGGANPDRRGPDDPPSYTLRPNLNSWVDTIPGRTLARYLYKIAYVDSAQNRGPLSKASPPVDVPKVVPPRTPVITKITGGDRAITIQWAANREPDLAGYRIYRTEDREKARDVRLMAKVGEAGAGDLTYTDAVPGGVTFHYRVAAIDTVFNESIPTMQAMGRAYHIDPPDPPEWGTVQWIRKNGQPAIELVWTANESGLTCRLQRRPANDRIWVAVAAEVVTIKPNEWACIDTTVQEGVAYRYRVRVRDGEGNLNAKDNEYFIPSPLVQESK